ncbi:hypothetical protein FRC12_002412 [Ceratobasidium sp. 428]|nr:hypothetical protein FRC12_002412 [Ceratobasidium sp. 428]
MHAFTSLFAVAALAATQAAAHGCQPPTSFGVEFVDQPCANSYYASYQDLGVQFGSSYTWEHSGRGHVKHSVPAPAHTAPAVKCQSEPACIQVCPSTKKTCA